MNPDKIIDAKWRTGADTVGIVAFHTIKPSIGDGAWRAVIGAGQGLSTSEDTDHIADYGARLTKEEAYGFFPELDISKYVND